MTTERLLGLATMNIHYEKPTDYDAVVQFFAERYRRMLLVDPVINQGKSRRNSLDRVYSNFTLFFDHEVLALVFTSCNTTRNVLYSTIPCSMKHRIENSEINAVYFYHSFRNENLHRCFTTFSDILMQKERHFHFKK